MLMPAIRAIYFTPTRTTIAHAKKRASIEEKALNINSLAIGNVLALSPDAACAAHRMNK
jgi:hypothetical protein